MTRSVGRSKTQRGNSSTDFGSSSELSWPKTETHFSRQGGWFFVFSHRLKALRLKSSAQGLLRFHTFARFVALQTWFAGQPRPCPNVPVRGICRAHCKHYSVRLASASAGLLPEGAACRRGRRYMLSAYRGCSITRLAFVSRPIFRGGS